MLHAGRAFRRRPQAPKAYIVLAEGWEPGPGTAKVIFEHSREVLAPYKRIRRLEFAALPKTISGKIRRVELRRLEEQRTEAMGRQPQEFREEDLLARLAADRT